MDRGNSGRVGQRRRMGLVKSIVVVAVFVVVVLVYSSMHLWKAAGALRHLLFHLFRVCFGERGRGVGGVRRGGGGGGVLVPISFIY